ncbi:hypothetical protein J7E81_22415 [Bacillus sp. ISL-18]|nr:hypothetical protein [Bacillus sp. ISL-18]
MMKHWNQVRQIWEARNVTIKSAESYIVFSYEYVLRFVKAENQLNIVNQLLEWSQLLFDNKSFQDIERIEQRFENELIKADEEMDIEMNWDDYLQRTYYITGKVLAGRTINKEEIEWLKHSFFEDFPYYLFLLNYTKDYESFFQINKLVQKIKMTNLYYLYIEKS